jgi:hypothetical protein
VLHYGLSEKYGAHMDTFFDARHIGENDGGQRIATALMFLNEPEEGALSLLSRLRPACAEPAIHSAHRRR